MPSAMGFTGWTVGLILSAMIGARFSGGADSSVSQDTNVAAPPVVLTPEQDQQRIMNLLHISSLRGANGNNPQAPNAANYDESKANPYPKIPDPLILKSGRKVSSAKVWWNQRRAEIFEDFDREIYGRVPRVTPKVTWDVTSTTRELKYEVPVITKQLVGRVDNSSYPLISVDIRLTLTTPVNATGPVPVIMEFGFSGPRPRGSAGVGSTGATARRGGKNKFLKGAGAWEGEDCGYGV